MAGRRLNGTTGKTKEPNGNFRNFNMERDKIKILVIERKREELFCLDILNVIHKFNLTEDYLEKAFMRDQQELKPCFKNNYYDLS